jgi:hypothetical protein
VDGALRVVREGNRNDGADGESAHLVCDEVERLRAQVDKLSACLLSATSDGRAQAIRLAERDDALAVIENLRAIVSIGSRAVQSAVDERARVLAGSESGDSTGAYMRNIETQQRRMREEIVEAVILFCGGVKE